MIAGRCRGRVHQPSTLGIGGRRVLVSRDWSGKTLADHRADQQAWVRQVLALGLGHEPPDQTSGDTHDGCEHQDVTADNDSGWIVARRHALGVRWERADPRDPDVTPLHRRIWRALGQRIRWRAEWHAARDRLAIQTGTPGVVGVSATRSKGGP
jgi:hypothetical protein